LQDLSDKKRKKKKKKTRVLAGWNMKLFIFFHDCLLAGYGARAQVSSVDIT